MAVQLRKFAPLLILASFALPLVTQAATISKPPNFLGLVAYWSFDEGGGTTVSDHSGNGDSGTLAGSPTFGPGKFGKALTLNGSTDYVAMATGTTLSFPNQTFTVSFWEKETTSVNWIMANQAIGGGWGIQATGVVFLKDGVNNQSQYTPTASTQTGLRDGKWHHVVYVITTNTSVSSSQNVTMYVDNVLDGGSLNKATVYAAVNRFMIGTRSDNNGQSGALWAGSVDDIRIYSRGLSTTEISSLYQEKAANIKMPNANGLVGYWNFSEGGGTTAGDHSFNGNVGQVVGATWSTLGKLGSALSFDGSTSYVAMSNAVAPATGYTVLAWVNPTITSGTYSVYNFGVKTGCNPSGQELRISSGHFAYHPGCGGTLTSNATVSANQWTHIVLTVDSSKQATMYVNGAYDIGPVDESASQSFTNGNDTIGVAWVGGVLSHFFPGKIDEVRVYNRVLSAAEISTLYKAQSATVGAAQSPGTLSSGLVGWWTFDGKDITTSFVDHTGNGFNGYLVGTNNATSSRETIGKLGQGFSFAGQNTGAVDLGTSASLTPTNFTIAGWINFSDPNYCYNYIYSNSRDVSGGNGIEFKVYCSGSLSGNIWNGGSANSISVGIASNAGKWTHVAFTANGSTMQLYVNGVQAAQQSQTLTPGTPSFHTCIGSMGNSNCTTYTINGKMDDVRLYNRALSASEIQHLYSMGK